MRPVAIQGGGVDGWMSALGLAAGLRHLDIAIYIEPAPAADPPALACLPSLKRFLALVGIAEKELVGRGIATFRLGTAVTCPDRPAWFEPFGTLAATGDGLSFQHYWAEMRRAQRIPALHDFAVSAKAAARGRFAPPVSDPRSPLAAMDYGFQIDTAGFTALLREHALARGVSEAAAPADALHVETQARPDDWEDWSDWIIPHGVEWSESDAAPDKPYVALDWSEEPSLHLHVPGRTFCAKANLEQSGTNSGVAIEPWTGSHVHIGAAAGWLGPMAARDLDLTQAGILQLLELFPASEDAQIEAAEFNRRMGEMWRRARDFELLRQPRRGDLPPELTHKIAQFAAYARIVTHDAERASPAEWATRALAHGTVPASGGPLAAQRDPAELARVCAKLDRNLAQLADRLPPHRQMIQQLAARWETA